MANVLVIGGNRGIGLEIAKQLSARGDSVTVTCRAPSDELLALGNKVARIEGVDVVDETSIRKVADAMKEASIDVLVLAAGVLEPNGMEALDLGSIRAQFEINALAPLRFTSALATHLAKGAKVAILTSRMGSIADNTSGGHYGYRMSKAALNAAGKSLAHDLAPRGVSVAILHPGFVRTRMTRENGLIEADESARLLIARIDALTPETTGTFWHSNGEVLPW